MRSEPKHAKSSPTCDAYFVIHLVALLCLSIFSDGQISLTWFALISAECVRQPATCSQTQAEPSDVCVRLCFYLSSHFAPEIVYTLRSPIRPVRSDEMLARFSPLSIVELCVCTSVLVWDHSRYPGRHGLFENNLFQPRANRWTWWENTRPFFPIFGIERQVYVRVCMQLWFNVFSPVGRLFQQWKLFFFQQIVSHTGAGNLRTNCTWN